MYYEHFGLKQAPFGITPNTDLFFSGARRGDTLEALIYAIVSGEGIVKVVGEVGSGKTMLCRMLETKLPPHVSVAYVSNPRLDPSDVLRAITTDLHLALAPAASRFEVLNALQHALLERHAQGQHVVVFVEEAQGMQLETLEEIRLLTNLETQHQKLLQVVLFGQPELDTLLSDPRIRQLRERITHSFYLGPLDEAATHAYIEHRLHVAGYAGRPLFDSAATRLLLKGSRGWMRRINILADKALLAAFSEGCDTVQARHMQAAIADSEFCQGLTPRNHAPHTIAVIASVVVMLMVFVVWYARSANHEAPIATVPPPSPPVAITAPVPAIATTPDDLVEQGLAHGRAWMQVADPSHWSIQVLQVPADATQDVEKFLRKPEVVAQLEHYFVFPVRVKGRVMYGVAFGDFADRAQANEALESMAQEFKRYKPYLRSVAQLRAIADDSGPT